MFAELAKSTGSRLRPPVTCETAVVSKFVNKNNAQVYDVLLRLDERSCAQIASLRAFLFTESPPQHWNVRVPHITFSRSFSMRDLEYNLARAKKFVHGTHEQCTFQTTGVATKL